VQLFRRVQPGGISLQAQIRQMLVSAVLDGQLPVGVPIPSSRELADQLGVARNTVVLAYQQLVDEGLLVARQRSGFYVNPHALAGRVKRVATQAKPARAAAPDWTQRFRFEPSKQRNIVKCSDWQKYPYPFLYGQFDPSLFPTADWRECCLKALSVLDIREWAPDLILRDDTTLIQQVQARVLPRRGVWASADEIVVTVGAQHALYLLADLLMTQDTVVGVEDPGYPDARNAFASRAARLVPLPVDDDGITLTPALRGCHYVYVTPSHQCPSTVTMPLARREALLEAVQECDAVVIEDDYESENRFDGDPFPALKSLDRSDRVIYVGSLSKTFAPGLRVGYIVGPVELIGEMRALRRLALRHPSAYIQRAFSLFLSLGHYDALLRRLSAAYRERAEALSAALRKHMPEARFVPIAGGASCWVVGPPWLDAEELARNAELQGVLIEPGDVFFAADRPPSHYARLGFASIAADRIEDGVVQLAHAWRETALRPATSSR
jgi:GntR family transcriptional regulator / MocR family aminotransferase